MGTPGNDVVDRLQVALDAWSKANGGKSVKYIRKVTFLLEVQLVHSVS
jgi:hypothetical protein